MYCNINETRSVLCLLGIINGQIILYKNVLIDMNNYL